jgi:hypothetical protein
MEGEAGSRASAFVLFTQSFDADFPFFLNANLTRLNL